MSLWARFREDWDAHRVHAVTEVQVQTFPSGGRDIDTLAGCICRHKTVVKENEVGPQVQSYLWRIDCLTVQQMYGRCDDVTEIQAISSQVPSLITVASRLSPAAHEVAHLSIIWPKGTWQQL